MVTQPREGNCPVPETQARLLLLAPVPSLVPRGHSHGSWWAPLSGLQTETLLPVTTSYWWTQQKPGRGPHKAGPGERTDSGNNTATVTC